MLVDINILSDWLYRITYESSKHSNIKISISNKSIIATNLVTGRRWEFVT